MCKHPFVQVLASLVLAFSLACFRTPTRLQTVTIAREACPTGHEFEEVGAQEVPAVTGSVTVRYSDGQIHPLPGAVVHLTHLRDSTAVSVRTGPDGLFSLEQVSGGSYRMVVCAEGFVTLESTVRVNPKARPRTLNLQTHLDW
jgi:hypothetical protein